MFRLSKDDDFLRRNIFRLSEDDDFLKRWVAIGSPKRCIDEIHKFASSGATTITLRLIGHDEENQFDRVTTEILPELVA